MGKDYVVMVIIIIVSFLLPLFFVNKRQIKKAFFAMLVAQTFSWPATLTYVLLGIQKNPIRLFPHAADSNFLFAFIFYPNVFVVYYLHFPKQKRLAIRVIYTAIITALTIFVQLLADLYTDLVHYPKKTVLISFFLVIFIIFNISRKYIDWFFNKAVTSMEE